MPSLVVSDHLSASPELMDSKKLKKSKKIDSMDLDAVAQSIEEQKSEKKKKKKEKKQQLESSDDDPVSSEKKKTEKKRKASDEEEGSDSGSEGRENKKEMSNGSSLKKVKLMDKKDEDDNPNAVSRFRISEAVKEKLKSKGIEALFPIQAMTFDMILDGSDMVGRARTGQVMKCRSFLLIRLVNFLKTH